ncbi:hypothetical protein ACJX0J_021635, partial [Zea mays]
FVLPYNKRSILSHKLILNPPSCCMDIMHWHMQSSHHLQWRCTGFGIHFLALFLVGSVMSLLLFTFIYLAILMHICLGGHMFSFFFFLNPIFSFHVGLEHMRASKNINDRNVTHVLFLINRGMLYRRYDIFAFIVKPLIWVKAQIEKHSIGPHGEGKDIFKRIGFVFPFTTQQQISPD